MKVTLITNVPAPYRIPIFNRVARVFGEDFLVIFCARIEPNRQWNIGSFEFNHIYLKERCSASGETFVHNNPDVIRVLRHFRPEVIITSGFNPTHLFAWGYAMFAGAKHISMTDGWIISERKLGLVHRILRRIVFRTSSAFIGASRHSLDLYRSYGCADTALHQSHLCIDNAKFTRLSANRNRPHDFMFSGQIVAGKIPDFFVEVVQRIIALRGKASVLVIGGGELRETFLNSLNETGAEVTYAGFIRQEDLPFYYSQAKLLLFTTICDAWGIVANEALASGTPVVTTPYAGAAHDLVIDDKNGYVIDTDASLWATKINELLQDEPLLEQMRLNAVSSVTDFNFANAAHGIVAAAQQACNCLKRPVTDKN